MYSEIKRMRVSINRQHKMLNKVLYEQHLEVINALKNLHKEIQSEKTYYKELEFTLEQCIAKENLAVRKHVQNFTNKLDKLEKKVDSLQVEINLSREKLHSELNELLLNIKEDHHKMQESISLVEECNRLMLTNIILKNKK